MKLQVGQQVGPYRILSLLGAGGMGEVYLAHDPSLDRQVALKFLPESMEKDEKARQLLLREARSAAALDHPYICKIYEIGEAEARPYIAMERVEGRTLEERISQGPLPLTEALETAHQRNIVHRDLKPSNVMLTSDSHVKVMDFGLAKRLVTEGVSREQTHSRP